MRNYMVKVQETYADGHVWTSKVQIKASKAVVAVSKAIRIQARVPLPGHGRVIEILTLATEN